MSSTILLIIFFLLFISEYLCSTGLTILNINNSIKNRLEIPPFMKDSINMDKYNKSVQYTIRKENFALLISSISSLITAIIILGKVTPYLYNKLAILELHPYIHGISFLILLIFLSSLLSMPFSFYSQFVIEEEFGFNKMTLNTFIKDTIKSAFISLLFITPLLYILFLFMDKAGNMWWIYGFAFFMAFQLLLILLYPLLIAPLFNKFTNLEEGSLKEKLSNLAIKTSFKAKGIYLMDGSKRSAHSNAYFTGFGKSRRIVLFDTLVESLSEDEIVSVLAHEIGHFKKKHIIKGLIISLITSGIFFFIMSLILSYRPLFLAFGFNEPSLSALLVIISFALGPLSFFLKPILSLRSRKNEYEADKYAFEITGSSEFLKNALMKLGEENLSNLNPHKLYSFFHYSHPQLSERIAALEKLNQEKSL